MKRLYFLLAAMACPFAIGSCEEIIDLETHLEIDLSNVEGWGDGGNIGNGNGNGTGGTTIGIGFGSDGQPENNGDPIDYELIMPLDEMITVSSQGGDCWGDYFFQFGANYNKVQVYNLALHSLVQTIYIQDGQKGFVPNCHANTVCFGKEYYTPEDQFPLIYVSTGFASVGYSGVLVYRIVKNARGSFSISLVQTLKFPTMGSSWTEFITAGDYAYLFYPGERMVYIKMPALKEGDRIIDPTEAMESYQFPLLPDWMGSPRGQGCLFHQGRVIYVAGLSQGFSGLIVMNLEQCEHERIFNFKKNGLNSEPECVFVWQGDLCVALKDQIVKLISSDIP